MEKDDLWKNFENIQNLIQNCDNKVMIILGFIGALGLFVDKKLFLINFSQVEILIWLNIILVSFFVISYVMSIFFLFKSINPNIKVKYDSLIFFGNIALKSYQGFKTKLSDNNYDFEDDLQKQIHVNSRIATRKYASFKKSLLLLGLSLVIYILIKLIWL